MALNDPMTSRFSQLSLAVPHHVINGNGSSSGYHEDDASYAGLASQRRDSDTASTSSHANAATSSAAVPTSMAYLPQTVVLCELRHAAFEASTPTGPSDSGLVSKWRLKDRMKTGCVALVLCLNISVDPPDVIKISPCARMECWIVPMLVDLLSMHEF